MALRTVVHKGGVATFPTLPSDSYAYQIDYEQHEGRVWLKSDRTAREWCVLAAFVHGRCVCVFFSLSRDRSL